MLFWLRIFTWFIYNHEIRHRISCDALQRLSFRCLRGFSSDMRVNFGLQVKRDMSKDFTLGCGESSWRSSVAWVTFCVVLIKPAAEHLPQRKKCDITSLNDFSPAGPSAHQLFVLHVSIRETKTRRRTRLLSAITTTVSFRLHSSALLSALCSIWHISYWHEWKYNVARGAKC